jgi:polyphenol oxidase
VWAGPAIGPCCFEVGRDVASAVTERFGANVLAGDRHVDLWETVAVAARRSGAGEVYSARLCTRCHSDLFFSHRGSGGQTGRQALVVTVP